MLSTDIAWHEVSITLFSLLQDLSRVATFDWGSTALLYLYYRLNTVYRGAVMMCGFWDVLHVYFSIPSLMLWSCSTTGTKLRIALDASTLLEHSRHYQQYIQENLLEQVLTDLAEVNLSTSYLFISSVLSLTVLHSSRTLVLLCWLSHRWAG